MKGILTTVAVVAVVGAGYMLWKKAHENEEEILEEQADEVFGFEK